MALARRRTPKGRVPASPPEIFNENVHVETRHAVSQNNEKKLPAIPSAARGLRFWRRQILREGDGVVTAGSEASKGRASQARQGRKRIAPGVSPGLGAMNHSESASADDTED